MDHTEKSDTEGTPENINPETGKSPHDEFFTYVFSDTANVRDLLHISLPEPVLRLFKLEHLTVSKETFIDEELRRAQSDILVQTSLEGNEEPALIYVLVEHKSYPDRWTLLQLLKYMVRIWEKRKKEHCKALPVIVPMIFYHGKARWRHPLRFSEYFNIPAEMHCYVPGFSADLIDARCITISRAGANNIFQSAMLAFRYSFRMLEKHVPEIFATFADSASDEHYRDFINAIIRYILLVLKGGYEEEVRKAVNAINMREVEEAYMTIAEKLRREGMEKGIEEGLEKGRKEGELKGKLKDKQQVLIRQLSKKYSLTDRDRQNISSITDPEKLDLALDEIVVAETKEQVLKLLK